MPKSKRLEHPALPGGNRIQPTPISLYDPHGETREKIARLQALLEYRINGILGAQSKHQVDKRGAIDHALDLDIASTIKALGITAEDADKIYLEWMGRQPVKE